MIFSVVCTNFGPALQGSGWVGGKQGKVSRGGGGRQGGAGRGGGGK